MKNLLRKFKLLFRKPRVGEFWSIDRKGTPVLFEVIKKHSKGNNEDYEIHYIFKFSDGWTWEGPIGQAGPIYLARNNSLEFGLDAISKLPPQKLHHSLGDINA